MGRRLTIGTCVGVGVMGGLKAVLDVWWDREGQ